MIGIVDQNNRIIGSEQGFSSGTYIYYFTEQGPVTGIRIARMRTIPDVAACSLNAEPAVLSGTFYNNSIYNFTLKPTNNRPKMIR